VTGRMPKETLVRLSGTELLEPFETLLEIGCHALVHDMPGRLRAPEARVFLPEKEVVRARRYQAAFRIGHLVRTYHQPCQVERVLTRAAYMKWAAQKANQSLSV
jgi:hypothetical protein